MKNPLYTWLTPLLTVLITVLGFVLLRPEETTALYWINMSYILVLEALFFGWFEVGRWKNTQTNYFSVFLGVHALYYIAASLLWMGLYSLLLYRWASLTVYGIGIGVLTVGWLITLSIVGRQDAAYNTQQTRLEEDTQDVRDLVATLRDMYSTHATEATDREWKRLIREAESLPPKQIAAQYDRLMQKAKQLIDKQ